MAQAQLRASHFTLGGTQQPNQFVSTMKMNFKPGQESAAPPQSVGDKLNVRASHFQLGDHRNNYQTSFKNHYPVWTNVENAKLNDEKKHDLRTNHFVLGHQDGNRLSVTKQTYTEKPIQPNIHNEQEAQKTKMRAHHHTFAETEAKPMRTYYNEQYQGYPADAQQKHATKEEMMEKVVSLRQSHIILGREKLPMQSIQQKEFNLKQGVIPEVKKVAPQQSHFILGADHIDFKTSNQEFHTPQPIEISAFAAENQQNLRATHFTLGQDGQPYKSEAMANFKPASQGGAPHLHTKQLQSNNFQLGSDPVKPNHYQTQYSAAMKPPVSTNQHQQGQIRDQKNDRGSSFVVGTMVVPYTSEFQSHFSNNGPGKPASLDARVMKDLRSSHFRFNDVASNQFKTTTGQNYSKQPGQPNNLDPNLEADLRSHHFKLGQTNPNYISAMHNVHRPLDGKPNQLNAQLARDLRTHHFELS